MATHQSTTDGVAVGVETQCGECFYQWSVAMRCLSQEGRRSVETVWMCPRGQMSDWETFVGQSRLAEKPCAGWIAQQWEKSDRKKKTGDETKREWKRSNISWREAKWWDKVNKSWWVSDGSVDKRENEDRRERRRQLRVGFWLGGCQKATEKWRAVKRLQESAWAHDNCLLASWLPPPHLLPTRSTNSLRLLTHADHKRPRRWETGKVEKVQPIG